MLDRRIARTLQPTDHTDGHRFHRIIAVQRRGAEPSHLRVSDPLIDGCLTSWKRDSDRKVSEGGGPRRTVLRTGKFTRSANFVGTTTFSRQLHRSATDAPLNMMLSSVMAQGAARCIVRTTLEAEPENLSPNNATNGTPFDGFARLCERIRRAQRRCLASFSSGEKVPGFRTGGAISGSCSANHSGCGAR